MTAELINFLRDRLDETAGRANAATPGPWSVNDKSYAESIDGPNGVTVVGGGRWGGEASVFESTEDALHIAEHNPAHVLADIKAKRAIVEKFERAQRYASTAWGQSNAALAEAQTLKSVALLLASAYASHPDFREEWRP